MPFKIVRNDITRVKADVIVNTANPNPICASGTDLAIYEAAGKEKLLAERANIGKIFSQKERTSAKLQEVILLSLVHIA